jgi:tripartite-type tricarboxylate transporter receptor subunit TctC
MKKATGFFLAMTIAGAAVWGAGTAEPREKFPTKPIEIYVGFAAGGGTDILARQLARNMEPVLGQSVVIVNKGGGGGLIALKEMAAKRADGYTLGLLLGNQFLQKHYKGSETWIDPLTEVILLGVFNLDPWGIAVQASAPFNTIQEVIAYARRNPGLKVGAGSPGTLYYWTWQALMDATGINLTIVPFGGTALSLTSLAGGELAAAGAGPPEADSLMKSGLVKMIGIASNERLAAYPNIPTFKEGGFDMVIGPWRSLVGPKGIPDDVAKILADAVEKAYKSEPFQKFIREQGFGAFFRDRVEGKKFFEQEDEFFRSLMKKRGELRGR